MSNTRSVFHQISKHLGVVYKNSAVPRFFNLLLSVWISDEHTFSCLIYFFIIMDRFLGLHPPTSLIQKRSSVPNESKIMGFDCDISFLNFFSLFASLHWSEYIKYHISELRMKDLKTWKTITVV